MSCLKLILFLALTVSVVLSAVMDRNEKRKNVRKFIVDTDAGGDDAVGLLLALLKAEKDEDVQIIAITCVNGNTRLRHVVNNVRKTLAIATDMKIPVYPGADRPILDKNPDDNFFGMDGFGDFEFPQDVKMPKLENEHAVTALIRLVKQHKGEINVIALGPLTNLALAMRLDAKFRENIKTLYIMGGNTEGRGNIEPGKEFNFLADPEANYIVFNSTESPISPIELLPWDTIVLRSTTTMRWRNEVLGRLGSKYTDFINKVERVSSEKSKNELMWASADPRLVACAIWPETVTHTETHFVRAVLQGELRGSLIVDYADRAGRHKNVKIISSMDEQLFREKLIKYFS